MIETRAAILSYADGWESFRFADLFAYLNILFETSKGTLSWYLRETHKYIPQLNNKTIKTCTSISKAFPFISVSSFDGEVLADFQHHLSSNNLHYIKVDREAMVSVYDNMDISKDTYIVKPLINGVAYD